MAIGVYQIDGKLFKFFYENSYELCCSLARVIKINVDDLQKQIIN